MEAISSIHLRRYKLTHFNSHLSQRSCGDALVEVIALRISPYTHFITHAHSSY